jgi:hypothetical protein
LYPNQVGPARLSRFVAVMQGGVVKAGQLA